MEDTTSSFGVVGQQPTNSMEGLRRSILSLNAHDMAELFLENEILRIVFPVVQGIQCLIEAARSRPH